VKGGGGGGGLGGGVGGGRGGWVGFSMPSLRRLVGTLCTARGMLLGN